MYENKVSFIRYMLITTDILSIRRRSPTSKTDSPWGRKLKFSWTNIDLRDSVFSSVLKTIAPSYANAVTINSKSRTLASIFVTSFDKRSSSSMSTIISFCRRKSDLKWKRLSWLTLYNVTLITTLNAPPSLGELVSMRSYSPLINEFKPIQISTTSFANWSTVCLARSLSLPRQHSSLRSQTATLSDRESYLLFR